MFFVGSQVVGSQVEGCGSQVLGLLSGRRDVLFRCDLAELCTSDYGLTVLLDLSIILRLRDLRGSGDVTDLCFLAGDRLSTNGDAEREDLCDINYVCIND